MKPFRFNQLSDKRCTKCNKPLKKNLLAKKPNATMCWSCWYPIETKRKGGHGNGRIGRAS